MVFASYVASLLSTYLGKFIKGLNKDAINVSLLRGSIELKGLELSPTLFSFSEILRLKRGTIDSLSVKVPWHSLYSKRCEVAVRGVTIVLEPKSERHDAANQFFGSKEEFFVAVQGLLADKERDKPEVADKKGFLHRLQHTILKNIVFHLENAFLQLEETTGCWEGKTAGMHVRLKRLICEAVDSNHSSVFIPSVNDIESDSLHRLVSYEGLSVQFLYSSIHGDASSGQLPSQSRGYENVESFRNSQETLVSSSGSLIIVWKNQSSTVQSKPHVFAGLKTMQITSRLNESCIMAIGVLVQGLKQAPCRALAWDRRPPRRIRRADPVNTSMWWSYAIFKIIRYAKVERDRKRFNWVAYKRRKAFLASLFTFCLRFLRAPWIPEAEGQSLDEDQLARTSMQDVMGCWNSARECLEQFQLTRRAPQGNVYTQYLQYHYEYEQRQQAELSLELNYFSLLPVEMVLSIECAEFAVAFPHDLRGSLKQIYVCSTLDKNQIHLQFSVASSTVFVDENAANPVLSIVGEGSTGLLFTASKLGHSPACGKAVIEQIEVCFNPNFQDLLYLSVTSCVLAAKPFVFEDPFNVSDGVRTVRNSADHLEIIEQEPKWSEFDITVRSITVKAEEVCLQAAIIRFTLLPEGRMDSCVQEINVVAHGATLLYLCSITVTPVVSSDEFRIEVKTISANISTSVEGFEYVVLLLRSIAQRWPSHASRPAADLQTKSSLNRKQNSISKIKTFLISVELRFEFIEYGALALEAFSIRAIFGDGWHICFRAAGCTTEGWCHSIPPQSHDPFIRIDLWAGGFLVHSPFAGNIEDKGSAFQCNFSHVTLCLGDSLISSVESFYDTLMMALFEGEDRHVHLCKRDKYTIPFIAGLFTGSHMLVHLESNGDDVGSLPECTGATTEANRNGGACGPESTAPPQASPPPPLTVELLGNESVHISFHRYGDKRMDTLIVLQEGLNAYLIGTPARIPLFVQRGSMRVEVDFHTSAPSDADLSIFPYSRLRLAVRLFNVAFVAHIPTLMTIWSHFDTPSLPLCRLRNIGSRLHFSSHLDRPGRVLAPRSPVSASVEAIGSAAFDRISRVEGGALRGVAESLPTLASSATYSTPVFPSDMRLCVEVGDSELYYPWGEGSVAPLYLHTEVPRCKVIMLNRDGCLEVTVRGLIAMPRVAAALHTFSRAMDGTATPCTGTRSSRLSPERKGEYGASEEAPSSTTPRQHLAHVADGRESCVLLEHLTHVAPDRGDRAHFSCSAAEHRWCGLCNVHSSTAAQAAFPDDEYFATSQNCASPLSGSSLIQVHIVYTMDSRPPFWPGNSDESLRVSLTPHPTAGTGLLPGLLCSSLRSPAEVATWLTFFTFFNPTNTVPLTSVNHNAAASSKLVYEEKGGGDGGASSSTPPKGTHSLRRLVTNVRIAPIAVHLPFAGVAAVLWDGVEFVASPGYSALRVPRLDVLVNEGLKCAPLADAAPSMQELSTLRDSGYAILSLRGSSCCGSSGMAEVSVIPAILLESHSTGPTAAAVCRQVVLPGMIGRLSDVTVGQLQLCATLAAVGEVVAAQGAQASLLNAVILQESQRCQLRYACCSARPASTGECCVGIQSSSDSSSDGTDVEQAQLLPFLSPPLALHIYSSCFTFEWNSKMQRGVRAGVTVGLERARFNGDEAHNNPSADQPTSDGRDAATHFGRRSVPPGLVPPVVEVEAVEAYVWWTTAEGTNTVDIPVGDKTTAFEGLQWLRERDSSIPPVTACMPLLLNPLQVHTRIEETAVAVVGGVGKEANFTSSAATAARRAHGTLDGEEDESVVAAEKLANCFSTSGDKESVSECARSPVLERIASTYTMPSTTSESKTSLTATAIPSSSRSPVRGEEVRLTPVFEVTPVHVVLNTSAYALLSETLLHHTQGTAAATTTGDPRPPEAPKASRVSQYYLTHRVVGVSTAARGSFASLSPPASSPISTMVHSRSAPYVSRRTGRRGFHFRLGRCAPPWERAQVGGGEATHVFYYDSAHHPSVWVERPASAPGQLQQHQVDENSSSVRQESRGVCDSFLDTNQTTQGEQFRMSVGFTPPPLISAMDGVPPLLTLPGSGVSVELQEGVLPDDHPKSPSPATGPGQMRTEPPEFLGPIAHVVIAPPRVAPQGSVIPRLKMRLAVAEVCFRLVSYRDVETTAATASEARDYWRRYTVVHAAARRAGAASRASDATIRRCCLMTFLATSVAPLRILGPGVCNNTNNGGINPSASNHILFQFGQLPASSTAAEQQHLAPTAMLEEACIDALCVRFSGLIVSSFTDAQSVQLGTCVCTSVQSPGRPLLSMTHVEVSVPSTTFTHPSVMEAVHTVAQDVQGAVLTTDTVGGMTAAPDAESARVSTRIVQQDTGARVASSAPPMPPPQVSRPTDHIGGRYSAGVKPLATCPTTASIFSDADCRNGDSDQGQLVVMQREVGCRLEALTVDLSAGALRVWLSCLVEHPIAVLRAALESEEEEEGEGGSGKGRGYGEGKEREGGREEGEKENILESAGNTPSSARTLSTCTVPAGESLEAAAGVPPILSPLQWAPGQGLRVHEVRGALWGLEHDITLSRDGLVLVFSSQDTNLLTVHLNGHSILIDSSLLLRPAGLQRVVMVVEGGLTVRFVGSGSVRLPLVLWRSSLVETTANIDVATVLLPFMAVGEGSYLECSQVRLGFTEPAVESSAGGGHSRTRPASIKRSMSHFSSISSKSSAVVEAVQKDEEANGDKSSLHNLKNPADVRSPPLVHCTLRLHLPHISIILEPLHELRQFHICAAVRSSMSFCNGRLLCDDVRCNGLTVLSEPIYDSAMTTARTTVLAPVDVEVCSNNGRHHSVSLTAMQVDLGRADLLIMSTYAGELQALRTQVKHLTHSKAEKEFSEIVEATLTWRASSIAMNSTDLHGGEGPQDSELSDDEGDAGDTSKGKGRKQERSNGDVYGGSTREENEVKVPVSRCSYAEANHTDGVSVVAKGTAEAARGSAKSIGQEYELSAIPGTEDCSQSLHPVARHGSATPGVGVLESSLQQTPFGSREMSEEVCSQIGEEHGQTHFGALDDAQWRQRQRRQHAGRRLLRRHPRGFSMAVFTPSVEVILSDHRHPLLQVCVQDVMVRRTSTSALASTSLLQCQRASVRVYGRGRWDVLLRPGAALTWSLTQAVSRHSSNRHLSLVVEGVQWQCSHLIVAKLLYVNHQLTALATSLTRRLTMAAAAVGGVNTRAPPASLADVLWHSDVTSDRGEEGGSGSDGGGGTVHWGNSVTLDAGGDIGAKSRESSGNSIRRSSSSVETFSDTSSLRPRRHAVLLRTRRLLTDFALTAVATASASRSTAFATPPETDIPVDGLATGGDILTASLPPYYQCSPKKSLNTAGAATISPSMATHRLLNSFSHTLFAGICEREEVARVLPTETPGAPTAAVGLPSPPPVPPCSPPSPPSFRTESASATGSIWRCNEIYRMPPASATDIFISYRRAHSLMLTFFTTECVEWDAGKGAWALNSKGETALAARAIAGSSRPTTRVFPPPQQQQRRPRDASVFPSGNSSDRTTNWFAFTSLHYDMAQPLTVYTTISRENAATTAFSPASQALFPSNLGNDSASLPHVPTVATPFSTGTATGVRNYDEGNTCRGSFKSLSFSLVLTCVDPEEEADTSRHPIVMANGEGVEEGEGGEKNNGNGSTKLSHPPQHREKVHRQFMTASADDTPAPLSQSAPFTYVDALAEEGASLADSTPKDVAVQVERPCSGIGAGAHNHRHRGTLRPGEGGGLSRFASLPTHPKVTSSHWRPDLHHGGNIPPSLATRNQRSSAHVTEQSRCYHSTGVTPEVRQPRRKLHAHRVGPANAVASRQAIGGGGGDLLVVRLQARSSLLNETGCTLELLFSHGLSTSADRVSDGVFLPTTRETVPPGWRLPLSEGVAQNEVLLRVCCPSTRCVPSPTKLRATDGGCRGTAGVLGTANDAATPLRWYETRIVLGKLESGRFLSCKRVEVTSSAADRPLDATAGLSHHRATTGSTSNISGGGGGGGGGDGSYGTFCDAHDERLLLLFVILTYSADGLVQHISLYPRLTLVNHLGLSARVAVFQQDPLAGPQTPDEAKLMSSWRAPAGHTRHERERFYRSLVFLGAHDALPHLHALPLHLCTYDSNLVLGLSFTQSTGDSFFTADLTPVIPHLRDAVDGHPRSLPLRDNHGRAFYVQVSVMPRTVVLSVALWVYNLTEYPLLMSHSLVRRRLCPGQSSTNGIIPSQGEPFLIGCQLADFTQCFFAIGMDGGWSGAVTVDVGSSGVLVSPLSRLGISRSCNYSILFPNAQEGQPMVIQITPRWVFYNNTSKRLKLHFHFPGLERAISQAEKQRRQLLMQEVSATATESGSDAASMPVRATDADDTLSTLTSIAAVQLNPGDYHVSSIGPVDGNRLRVQEVLEGTVPTVTSMTGAEEGKHCGVSFYYESQHTPYMDIDQPGEATFNLWAAPRALGKQTAVSYGGDFVVQRPSAPHPTKLEPYDPYACDAVVTGRVALSVQSANNVLAVLLLPIHETKIFLQNRTECHTVMVRQRGCRRLNRIPPRQNRFFLWEDVLQERAIRVHILGYKGRWFDVDFSAGECKVTRHVSNEAAATAEALDQARQLHPHPTQVHLQSGLHGRGDRAVVDFPFHVRGYTNTEKTRVTILVTEFPVPIYAAIDSWSTSQALSVSMTMVQLTWVQERSAYMVAQRNFSTRFVVDAAGDGMVAHDDEARRGTALTEGVDRGGDAATALGDDAHVSQRSCFSRHRGTTARDAVAGTSPSNMGNVALFTITLEGVEMERLATEDNENFYFAVHRMQWVDERRRIVFVYRARPRLPCAIATVQGSDAADGGEGGPVPMPPQTLPSRTPTSLPASFSSPPRQNSDERADSRTRRRQPPLPDSLNGSASAGARRDHLRRGGCAALLEPITAVGNRLLSTALGRSDAFLHSMEKKNDLEMSYSLIKHADGVIRYTELRFVLTPLVVELTDFWLADMIQEVRRLRVLLGLRKRRGPSQATTTPPLVLTVPALLQNYQQQHQRSTWSSRGGEDPHDTVMVGMPNKGSIGHRLARATSEQRWRRRDSVVLVNDDTDVEAQFSEKRNAEDRVASGHRSPGEDICGDETRSRRFGGQGGSLERGSGRGTCSDRDASSTTTTKNVCRTRTDSSEVHNNYTKEGSDAMIRWPTGTQATPQHPSTPLRVSAAAPLTPSLPQQRSDNAAGFLSQAAFLQQLVQEVRTRLERRRAVGVMVVAGSLVAPPTRGEKQEPSRSGKSSLLPVVTTSAGLEMQHQQLIVGAHSAVVHHDRGAARRGRPGDGLGGGSSAADIKGNHAIADLGSSRVGGEDDGGAGSGLHRATSSCRGASSVKASPLLFVERLEVQRVSLYVTFLRHSPDPLRPLLGVYAWMLPSQLRQREFYLPAWSLTRGVETFASLRARLVRWGMHSLREQWTKVTKLGTLLDALRFWQHRKIPLHTAPNILTLSSVQQQQQQERDSSRDGGKLSLDTAAPCVSAGGEEGDDSTVCTNSDVDALCEGAQRERPVGLLVDGVLEGVRGSSKV